MIIITGTRLERREVGTDETLCVSCCEMAVMDVIEHRAVRHFYWISAGRGCVRLYELQCHRCGAVYKRTRGYLRTPESRGRQVPPTQEELLEQRLERLWHDTDIDQMDADDRIEWVRGCIAALRYMGEGRARGGMGESVSALLAVGVIGMIGLTVVLWFYGNPAWVQMAGGTAVLVAVCVWRALVSTHKAAARAVEDHLVRSLLRIAPQPQELQDAIESLPKKSRAFGRGISARRLMRRLDRGDAGPLIP